MNMHSLHGPGLGHSLIAGLFALCLVLAIGCSEENNPVNPAPGPNPSTSGVACQITSATPSNGTAPLQVSFDCTASGGTAPYSYEWRFGDGLIARTKTISHTFQTAGTFTVRLVVADAHGEADTGTVAISVAAANQLACTATANRTSGAAPLQVNFTATAGGGTAPYSYSWSFGDGANSGAQNPSHSFTSPGTYTAMLTVTDAVNATATKSLTITVSGTGLSCTASANPTSGQAPLAVSFSSGASGGQPPYNYAWIFGDGGTSTQQNPSHTYSAAGTYTARLTVRDGNSSTVSRSVTITVTAPSSPLTCSASANKTSGLAPLTVSFTGGASGGQAPYTYSWSFGDGSSSSVQSPSHTYNSVGSYAARLTVRDASNAQCTKTIGISALSQASGPALNGPASSTGSITINWTFSWPPLAATGEGFSIEQSTSSPNSGFSEIAQIQRGGGTSLTVNRSPGTYYFRVRAYVNQGPTPGWTRYSNVVQVTVTAPASRTRIYNKSSYIIVSLVIDNVQYFPASPQGILPGKYVEVELSPGTHSFYMANGFWNGSSRFELYTLSGQINQVAGQTGSVNFNDPTVNQILTQFQSSGYWEGTFWQNLQLHVAGFRFYSNGTWRLYVDGASQSTGNYTLVSRSPGSFSLQFSVGGNTGTLYETFGKFTMRNGPPDWPLIEYFYDGQ